MRSTIQHYGGIGDGRSCALVAEAGSIDFLYWPYFDGDACLAAPLGDVINRTVCQSGYNNDLGHIVLHYASGTLDASLLLLAPVGFLPVDDPRVAGTIGVTERDLMERGFVRRKPRKQDGHDEGIFLPRSCWLADCYQMQGQEDEAAGLLEGPVIQRAAG